MNDDKTEGEDLDWAGKFVQRHRVGVAIAAAGVILLAGFAVRERIQLNRITRALEQANQEVEIATQVSEFLVRLFEVSDPRGNSITALEILDKGATMIDDTLADQPEVQARLMGTMGNAYRNLGLYEQAEPLLEQALATTERVLGDDHLDTLTSMNYLANLYGDQGRYGEAEPLFLQTLATRRRVLGDEHPSTLDSMNSLADLYHGQGRFVEGERLHREVLEMRRRVLGDEHPSTLDSMHGLADHSMHLTRLEESEALYLEALKTRKRVLGDDHSSTLDSMGGLALLYTDQGRYAEAEPLYLEALKTRKRVLGDDHRDTLRSMNNLAWFQLTREPADSRDPHAALKLALEVSERTGYENPGYLDTLSLAYHLTGDTAKAIENQKKAIALLPEWESASRTEYEENLAMFEAALKDGNE